MKLSDRKSFLTGVQRVLPLVALAPNSSTHLFGARCFLTHVKATGPRGEKSERTVWRPVLSGEVPGHAR